MPSWILWLSPVVIAPLLAVVWMSWAARPKGPVAATETVEEYDRFKAALTSPLPHPRKKPATPRPKAGARPAAPRPKAPTDR
jgi:hypothetical protein